MSKNAGLIAIISLMVNAVLFGLGVLTVINVPAFNREAAMMLPLCVLASFAITPMIISFIGPKILASRDRLWHR